MVVDPQHRYSNEVESANRDISEYYQVMFGIWAPSEQVVVCGR